MASLSVTPLPTRAASSRTTGPEAGPADCPDSRECLAHGDAAGANDRRQSSERGHQEAGGDDDCVDPQRNGSAGDRKVHRVAHQRCEANSSGRRKRDADQGSKSAEQGKCRHVHRG